MNTAEALARAESWQKKPRMRPTPDVAMEAAIGLGDQVRCRLLVDDPGADVAPNQAGDSGLWALSQIIVE